MTLLYADASALVKLVRDEPESAALLTYLAGAVLISSALALAEVPRAIRRAAADDPGLPLERLLDQAAVVLDAVALLPVEEEGLAHAGALPEPGLRSLDAIHLAAAVGLDELDGFLSYDQRQSAAARLSGLRTVAPGT